MNGNFGVSRRPGLVLLSGLPGTGKTTFAAALAPRLGAVHLESDAVRREVAAVPRYTAAEHAEVFSRVRRQARLALRSGLHVIVDATNLDPADRRPFFRLAHRSDAVLVAVRLTAPEALVADRLRAPRTGFSQAGLPVHLAMLPRLRPFSVPAVVVDTSHPLGPAIDLVARLVQDPG